MAACRSRLRFSPAKKSPTNQRFARGSIFKNKNFHVLFLKNGNLAVRNFLIS